MMTREEVAEVITSCKKNDISYKARLAERDIPTWKFYDSKSRYALEQESSEAKGESCKKQVFLQQQFSEKLISAAFRKDCSAFLIVFFCFKSNKGKDAVIVRIPRLLLGNRHAREKGGANHTSNKRLWKARQVICNHSTHYVDFD